MSPFLYALNKDQSANIRKENTEVYNLICDSIGIKALPNNGSLHLPLKPVGLHSVLEDDHSQTLSQIESQSFLSTATEKVAATSMHQISSKASSTQTMPHATNTQSYHNETNDGKGIGNDGDGNNGNDTDKDDTDKSANSWLSWFKEKFKNAKNWIKNKTNGDKFK